ncbi:hypothetical protein QBC34DRAFT_36584 [Podospora aff. communis PSN243]|uniref:HMG box domain-containing protein n=1 Tax=Podospora aff. communis PSN243 TaxID=3040156 RepID=A0AAV9GX09_9PEZI|nr:hypothetical protein QBC34DRAFT_36584 [Podospora aff. communis PSN243]
MNSGQQPPPPMAPSARVVSAPPGLPVHSPSPSLSPGLGTPNGPPPGPPPGQPGFTPTPQPQGPPMPNRPQGLKRGRPAAVPQPPPPAHPLYYPGAHPPQGAPMNAPARPPPQPMPPPPPPHQGPNPTASAKRPPVEFPPPHLPVPKRRRPDPPVDPTRLPLIPPFLAVAPAICKPREDVFKVPPPDTFSFSMHTVALDSPGHVALWKDQVESMARACGCYRELTTRFGVFPKVTTVEAAVIKFRYQTCWSILAETVSGPVWAYMRILGYNRIPVFRDLDGVQWQPSPVDAYYYAKQAGCRLHLPGSPHQNRAEVPRMVEEVRTAKRENYPTEEHFKKGIEWMRNVLDNMIRNGDRQVCESMYDAHPPFAPQWRMDVPYEGPWRLKGEPLLAIPKQNFRAPPQKNMRLERDRHEAELAQAEEDAKVVMEEYKRQFYVALQPPQGQGLPPPSTPIQQQSQLPSRAGSAVPSRAGSVAHAQRQREVIQIDDEGDEGSGDGDEDDFQDAEEGHDTDEEEGDEGVSEEE